MYSNMLMFKDLCDLPPMHGVVDETQCALTKPGSPYPKAYQYQKCSGYSMAVQAAVDAKNDFYIYTQACMVVLLMLAYFLSMVFIYMLCILA